MRCSACGRLNQPGTVEIGPKRIPVCGACRDLARREVPEGFFRCAACDVVAPEADGLVRRVFVDGHEHGAYVCPRCAERARTEDLTRRTGPVVDAAYPAVPRPRPTRWPRFMLWARAWRHEA